MGDVFAQARIGPGNYELVPLTGISLEKSLVQRGDLLFARRSLTLAGAGKCSIVQDGFNGTFESSLIRSRLNPSVAVPDFFFYYFQSPHGRAVMESIVEQTAVAGIRSSDLARLEVPCPPLSVQQAIASILGALDDKIELNRRMGRTLDEMAQAIFKSRFVDLDRHSVRDPATGLPPGWSRRSIGEVVRIAGGTTPSTKRDEYWADGIHGFCTPKDMSNLATPVLLETERHISDLGLSTIGSGLLPAGTVLMSSRAPIGYLAISEEPVAVNQGIIAMVSEGPLSPEFVLRWAKHSQVEIVSRANGSTFLEVSKGNFKQIPIVVPDGQSLAEFDEAVRPLHRRMVTCELEGRGLSAVRDALLPRVLSGGLRVPPVVEGVAGGRS